MTDPSWPICRKCGEYKHECRCSQTKTVAAPKRRAGASSMQRVGSRLPATDAELKKLEYRNSTVLLLRLRKEVFQMGGMSQKTFEHEYLNDLGPYERRVAREEGMEL